MRLRTYYDGIDGRVRIDHEQRGASRVTSRIVIGTYSAEYNWAPAVARAILASPAAFGVREFVEEATRHLIAVAIAAGHLAAERCDHVGEGGLCRRRWTIEVAYARVRLRRCAEHGRRFRYAHPGPSALIGRHTMLDLHRDFERVSTRE